MTQTAWHLAPVAAEIPARLLAHGSLHIAWHHAMLSRPVELEDTVLPTGTRGWFRRTSRHKGTFLPDVEGAYGLQMHANDVVVYPTAVQVMYDLAPEHVEAGA